MKHEPSEMLSYWKARRSLRTSADLMAIANIETVATTIESVTICCSGARGSQSGRRSLQDWGRSYSRHRCGQDR